MSWFGSNGSYTSLKRRSARVEPLTPEQAKYILKNPYNTGYTYANSRSYSINKPTDYIHPNLSRPSLSSSYSNSSCSNDSGVCLSNSFSDSNFGSRILWFIICIFTSTFTFMKDTTLWICSTLFKAIPLYPLYRGCNVTDFVKDAFVIFFEGILDFFYTNGYMVMQFKDDVINLFWQLLGYEYDSSAIIYGGTRYVGKGGEVETKEKMLSSWMKLLGLMFMFIILWWLVALPIGVKQRDDASVSNVYHAVTYPFFYGWNITKTIFSFVNDDANSLGHSVCESGDTVLSQPSTPPTSNIYDKKFAAKFSQWEHELDKIRKEVRSIGAVSVEADDARTLAAIDTQMRKLESVINGLFEKERQIIRIEKERLQHAMKDSSISKQHATAEDDVSEEEIAKLVHQFINKINLTFMVDQIVRYHVKMHISEIERNSTVSSNEAIEKKIKTTIFEALRELNYDKTGEPDFALESAGGNLLSTRSTKTLNQLSRRESIFGIPLWYTSYSPRSVIQRQSQNVNAGECWAIKGSEAYLVIRLARKIDVTAVSYEHLPRELSVSGNIDSAPKMFKIYSLQEDNDSNKFLIGEYFFDDMGEPLQRFDAQYHDPRGTSIIEFELISNYGASFTCLYRLRVHGHPL